MLKNILYAIAVLMLCFSAYFIYIWYVSEPANKEPLPALISTIATVILTIIAWRMEGNAKDGVSVDDIDESLVDFTKTGICH